ncbi:protein phosphatase 2C domain-containing protein [Aeromonas sobria]|uniref:protein phosphatase 2C domain-containing protein n=1 Tax=Aeromonas sobria TaxID=646 RepID=UPI0026E9CF9C|nr:protein phosphatase 2C domain-containing protein [Aeromonas sobria]
MQHALPCQDHALVHVQERPLLVLCDGAGAGSAACAEVGARALSEGMRRVLISLAPCLGKWLDEETGHDELAQLAMLLVRHAKGINADLAVAGRRSGDDFRATLLLAVAGKRGLFWLQVGDGLLALREWGYPASSWRHHGVIMASAGQGEQGRVCQPDGLCRSAAGLWLGQLGHGASRQDGGGGGDE